MVPASFSPVSSDTSVKQTVHMTGGEEKSEASPHTSVRRAVRKALFSRSRLHLDFSPHDHTPVQIEDDNNESGNSRKSCRQLSRSPAVSVIIQDSGHLDLESENNLWKVNVETLQEEKAALNKKLSELTEANNS